MKTAIQIASLAIFFLAYACAELIIREKRAFFHLDSWYVLTPVGKLAVISFVTTIIFGVIIWIDKRRGR